MNSITWILTYKDQKCVEAVEIQEHLRLVKVGGPSASHLMAERYRGISLPLATSLSVALRGGYGSTACSCQASQKQHGLLRDR